MKCSVSKSICAYFAGIEGIDGPFLHLKDNARKLLNATTILKLKLIYKSIPMFVLWKIWKRRNAIKHGGKMSYMSTRIEITRHLIYLTKFLFPWLRNIPNSWLELVGFLENYIPRIGCTVVCWKLPSMGKYKCNSDEASKGNLVLALVLFTLEMAWEIWYMLRE